MLTSLKQRVCVVWLAGLLAAGAFLQPAVAGAAGPVSLDDIREMRRERKKLRDILVEAKQRGLAFDVDKDAERRLRSMGFSRSLIAQFARLPRADAAGRVNAAAGDRDALLEAKGAGGGQAKPGAAGAQPIREKRKLDPQSEALYKTLDDRIDRTIKASALGLQKAKTEHTTLIARKGTVTRFVGDVERLEAMLRKRFPKPIATGKDPRAAHIAILDTRLDYEYWIRALFKIHKEDGVTFQVGEDPVRLALKSESIFLQGIFSVCIERMTPMEARHRIVFTVGFQSMNQLTRYRAPDFLDTGFGNVTEVMMFGEPWMMVKSGYVNREIGGRGANRWSQIVQERFKQRKIASVQNVLVYSTETMDMPQYAEAWTLTGLLSTAPDKFGKLVTQLRGGEKVWDTIQKIYEVDEKSLLAKWGKYARSLR